jgi:hypothetical protein
MTTLSKTDMRQSVLKLVAEGFKVIPLCNATADGKCDSEWAISPKGQYVCENPECGFLHPLDCSQCHPELEGGNGQ